MSPLLPLTLEYHAHLKMMYSSDLSRIITYNIDYLFVIIEWNTTDHMLMIKNSCLKQPWMSMAI